MSYKYNITGNVGSVGDTFGGVHFNSASDIHTNLGSDTTDATPNFSTNIGHVGDVYEGTMNQGPTQGATGGSQGNNVYTTDRAAKTGVQETNSAKSSSMQQPKYNVNPRKTKSEFHGRVTIGVQGDIIGGHIGSIVAAQNVSGLPKMNPKNADPKEFKPWLKAKGLKDATIDLLLKEDIDTFLTLSHLQPEDILSFNLNLGQRRTLESILKEVQKMDFGTEADDEVRISRSNVKTNQVNPGGRVTLIDKTVEGTGKTGTISIDNCDIQANNVKGEVTLVSVKQKTVPDQRTTHFHGPVNAGVIGNITGSVGSISEGGHSPHFKTGAAKKPARMGQSGPAIVGNVVGNIGKIIVGGGAETYEDFGDFDAPEEGPLCDSVLEELGSELGHEWKPFVLKLGISGAFVDRSISDHPHDTRSSIRRCLLTWRNQESPSLNEKFKKMVDVLESDSVGRTDLASSLREQYQDPYPERYVPIQEETAKNSDAHKESKREAPMQASAPDPSIHTPVPEESSAQPQREPRAETDMEIEDGARCVAETQGYHDIQTDSALLKHLKCSVCKETFTTPVSLPPCNHTFCRQCVQNVIQNCKNVREKGTFPCPLCRVNVEVRDKSKPTADWVDEFKPNYEVAHMVRDLSGSFKGGQGGN